MDVIWAYGVCIRDSKLTHGVTRMDRRQFILCLASFATLFPRDSSGSQDQSANLRAQEPNEDTFPVSQKDLRAVPRKYRRQEVAFRSEEPPGSLVVDVSRRYLYLVLGKGRAIRYGIGVGREGFEWAGRARVGRKAAWPRWIPPKEMVERDPFAAQWAEGMPGGPENPLGARALYLYVDNVDTLFRIHGTNQPKSIGMAVSSGCVRLLNADIVDLYNRVDVNASVLVIGPGEGSFSLSHKHDSNTPKAKEVTVSSDTPPRPHRRNDLFNLFSREAD